jgi:hypothetical protein
MATSNNTLAAENALNYGLNLAVFILGRMDLTLGFMRPSDNIDLDRFLSIVKQYERFFGVSADLPHEISNTDEALSTGFSYYHAVRQQMQILQGTSLAEAFSLAFLASVYVMIKNRGLPPTLAGSLKDQMGQCAQTLGLKVSIVDQFITRGTEHDISAFLDSVKSLLCADKDTPTSARAPTGNGKPAATSQHPAIEAINESTDQLDRWIGQVVSVFNYLETHQQKMNFGDAIGVLSQLQAQFSSTDKVYLKDKRLTKIITEQCPDFVRYGKAMGKLTAMAKNETMSEQCKAVLESVRQEFSHIAEVVHEIKYDEASVDRVTGNINSWRAIQILNNKRQRLHEAASEANTTLETLLPHESDSFSTLSKAVRLWQIGGFWLLAFSIVFGAVLVLVAHSAEWWQLAFGLIGLEVVLVLIGAFTLRTVGDLSEKNFLSLVGTAFREQFKVFTILKGLLSRPAATQTKTPNDEGKPKAT